MGNIWLFASVEVETSVNNVLERVILDINWIHWIQTHIMLLSSTLFFIVHHLLDLVFNDSLFVFKPMFSTQNYFKKNHVAIIHTFLHNHFSVTNLVKNSQVGDCTSPLGFGFQITIGSIILICLLANF